MRVEVLVNYEIPSLNTSPTLNLVQSYIFFPKLVSSLSIMSFSLMSMFLFLLKKNSLIMNIFVHSNWCLYVFENGVVCERLQLLAVCVNRIVNVHICMPIYFCCGRVGCNSEASYPVRMSHFIFYLNGSLWRVICCNDQCTNSFILLVFMMCVWREY